ncbi:GerAB/ArcD/ProY family transporter [Bacillus thuringiensis]|nr:GerAB/ArcD/ProY family transporter [Bacillus thuringiensis]
MSKTSVTKADVFLLFAEFNPYQVSTYIWPTLDLFETIEFPFVERIEVVFAAFYLFYLLFIGPSSFEAFRSSLHKARNRPEKDKQPPNPSVLPTFACY